MVQSKNKVKIPCNHKLKTKSLNYRLLGASITCAGCGIADYGSAFDCSRCNFRAHKKCIDWPDTIDYPCHPRHPLRKVSPQTIDYIDGECHFSRHKLSDPMYHCSLCNFSIDVNCWRDPPELTIYQPKSHEHTFTLLPRKITFTCNACGMVGDRNPYVCIQCGFMLHKDCIDLPRVININRHDHHVSRTYHLGHNDWDPCGVCRKELDWSFGGFTCKRCPHYAVHSKCATRDDVWDGKELEDVPEEEEEIEDPYKVINEKEIIHFSHKHNLILGDENVADYEKMRCDACMFPINYDSFFKCVKCKFFLHKVCASLPRRKRSIMHPNKLDLQVDYKAGENYCGSCEKSFDGFRYKAKSDIFDVRCASIIEPFQHELHPHPLFHIISPRERYRKSCGACGTFRSYVLSCIVCEFMLCMNCATLPKKVKHICDAHDLSLHHGAGHSKGLLWCDICEKETDPSVRFYGCDDCGTTLHVRCVLGDMYYLRPGKKYDKAELVTNDGMTRPICIVCKNRCMFPSFLKAIASSSKVLFVCSEGCIFTEEFMRHLHGLQTLTLTEEST